VADLFSLLDLADLAVARSDGVLEEADRAALAATTARLRSQGGFAGDVVVVALAGGTGSGKSSLLNALVSEPVAPIGIVRPTTTGSTAVVPAGSDSDFTRLLATLNVDSVVRSGALTSTILVDLPDFDSIETAHRHIVERVLPTVDAVVWVFDPEKYADSVVHEAFLSPMAPYEDQFIFVLNQVDRLGDHAESVGDDLQSKLFEDGYRNPKVVQCVAAGVLHVGDVADAIAQRFDTKSTALTKTALDLRLGANAAWKRTLKPPESDPEVDPGERALAQATFVWLGVDAYDYWYSIMRGKDAGYSE
jgi:GTP-binding protein EngB required for normal cell division